VLPILPALRRQPRGVVALGGAPLCPSVSNDSTCLFSSATVVRAPRSAQPGRRARRSFTAPSTLRWNTENNLWSTLQQFAWGVNSYFPGRVAFMLHLVFHRAIEIEKL